MTGLLNSTESYFRAKFFGTYRYDTNTRILIQIQNAVIASIPIKDVNVKKSAMVELPAESNSSVTEQQNSDSKLISIADKKKRFSHVVVASK